MYVVHVCACARARVCVLMCVCVCFCWCRRGQSSVREFRTELPQKLRIRLLQAGRKFFQNLQKIWFFAKSFDPYSCFFAHFFCFAFLSFFSPAHVPSFV